MANTIAETAIQDIGEGLEEGIWGGVKGAIIGYLVLPVLLGAAVAIGAPFAGFSVVTGLIAGAAAAGATALIGYSLNKTFAKWGAIVGGVLGFAEGVDEPGPERAPTIQLSPGQQLAIINSPVESEYAGQDVYYAKDMSLAGTKNPSATSATTGFNTDLHAHKQPVNTGKQPYQFLSRTQPPSNMIDSSSTTAELSRQLSVPTEVSKS